MSQKSRRVSANSDDRTLVPAAAPPGLSIDAIAALAAEGEDSSDDVLAAQIRQATSEMRLSARKPLYPPVAPNVIEAFRQRVNQSAQGKGLHGWGTAGEIVASIETVEKQELWVPPWHPRTDWDEPDRENIALVESVAMKGVQERIIVTPLIEGQYGLSPASRVRFVVIDGARRVGALQRVSTRDRCPVEVRTDPHTGGPLDELQAIQLYLMLHANRKSLKMSQLLYSLALLKYSYEEVRLHYPDASPFPALRDIARQFGVSYSMTKDAFHILEEEQSVIDAVALREVPAAFVLRLMAIITSRDQRADLVDVARQRIVAAREQGKPEPTVIELLERLVPRALPSGDNLPTDTSVRLVFTLPFEPTRLGVARLPQDATATQILGGWGSDFLSIFDELAVQGAQLPSALRDWLSLADDTVRDALLRLATDPELRTEQD